MRSALDRLETALQERSIHTARVASYEESLPLLETQMDIDCFLVYSDMPSDQEEQLDALKLQELIHARHRNVPLFLLADRQSTSEHLNMTLMKGANEFAWIFEDSAVFLAGRVESAIARYRNQLLPPLMKAIWEYNEQYHEYSWAAPGHQGGRGFIKSPAGKKFYDFYGENLFRTDTGIERSSIGSLLDHQGAFRDSEILAARVFGADESYSLVGGTSSANRTLFQACVTDKDFVLCDRNCHKSIEQGLILTGASPVYMVPTRNRYGIIGPIPSSEMKESVISEKLRNSIFSRKADTPLAYSVVTNCTYDGICYNAKRVEELLSKAKLPRIHFDEAWYAYARFNRMYRDHHAMRGDPETHRGATVYATHSTHKLLNALSQSSYIHVRKGRNYVDFDRFNQAYMMQSTTSPLYAICASNDISAKMMDECGCSLTREVIEEAVDFRQALARIERDFKKENSWFFTPWNPPEVVDPETGET
ncbi:MAG: arginine decarboxylase, partial [Lentisphaeria bacterium]|nr:arginine decarboxylase [Lentisphaeria bacterium]